MNGSTPEKLIRFLEDSGATFRILNHSPCRTSVESAAARATAGAADAVGAKALLVRKQKNGGIVLLVIPGPARLDSKAVRRLIGHFSFANADQVSGSTGGLQIGTIPPFGRPVLEGVTDVYVDAAFEQVGIIGFNAGRLDQSIIMATGDYVRVCGATGWVRISVDVADVLDQSSII